MTLQREKSRVVVIDDDPIRRGGSLVAWGSDSGSAVTSSMRCAAESG